MSRLGRLPLRLLGFLHCFPLVLGCLLQHLSLRLGPLLVLALIFLFDAGALSLSRYRPCNDRGGQQHENSNSFHNVSEPKILAAVLDHRSYTEAEPGLAHEGVTSVIRPLASGTLSHSLAKTRMSGAPLFPSTAVNMD